MSQRRLRIVQLGKYYPPYLGGIENNTRQCCQALAAAHDVTALVFNTAAPTVREKDGAVDVIRLGSSGRVRSQEICLGIFRELRRLQPDIVHLHAPNPLSMMAHRWLTPDVPLVITHHTDMVKQKLLRRFFLPTYRKLARRCARMIVYTQKYLDDCLDLHELELRTAIIPNGTTVPGYLGDPGFLAEAHAFRQRTAPAGPLLVFVGRFVGYKGLGHLVHSLAQTPGVTAVLAGNGPSHAETVALARQLGLQDRVHFPGEVTGRDKWRLLQAADFVVLPSINHTESFGQMLVEAHLCGKAAIVTDIRGGVTEVSPPGETSLGVPPADVPRLAEAIRRLAGDEALRRELGDRGLARAQNRFTQSVTDDHIRRLFAEVAAETGV